MTLYQQQMDRLTSDYESALKTLRDNQSKVEMLETIIKALKFNNIDAGEMVTVHSRSPSSVSLFVFPKNPSDDDIIKLLNLVCALVEASPAKILINDNANHCTYGYVISGVDGIKITVSLQNDAETFTPAYLQHLRHICQSTVPAFFFVGVDPTKEVTGVTA